VNDRFAPLIHDALWDPSPRESVSRVKAAVATELEALDRTAVVHTTDYFNHSYAPDIVMSWRDQPSRGVYLRLDRDAEELAFGARLVDEARPMIIGLSTESSTSLRRPLEPELGEAMVSSPEALDEVIARKERDATGSMLGNALAQGGKGMILQRDASGLADSVAAGFAGAERVEIVPTADAVEAMEKHLAAPQASRLTRVLQAVWEGGAGRTDEFPGSKDLSGRLGREATQYLIDLIENDDTDFWRRVGRRLTIADLAELDITRNPQNFHRLAQANLDVLEARACAVIDNPQREMEADQEAPYRWTLRRRRVALDCPGYYVILGESKPDIEKDVAGTGRGIDVRTFVARASGVTLHEVAIHDGKEGVTHTSDEGALDQARLLTLSQQLGSGVEVRRAVVVSPSGRVTVDFPNASGTGQTRSRVLAADVLQATLGLVRAVSESDAQGLRAVLAYAAGDGVGVAEPLVSMDGALGVVESGEDL